MAENGFEALPSAEVNSVHHFFSLLFCSDLGIHVDVSLTPGTQLSFVADQMHLYSPAYFCRAVEPRHLSEITQETYQKALQIPQIPLGLCSYNLNWENSMAHPTVDKHPHSSCLHLKMGLSCFRRTTQGGPAQYQSGGLNAVHSSPLSL